MYTRTAKTQGEETPADIRHAAMDLLARREHSRYELFGKLSRRFDNKALLDQQLELLAQDNLQCDRRFCEIFVRSKCQQGQGPRRISLALKQRGVESSLVDQFLWHADINWLELLQQLYERRYRDDPSDAKERAKRMRFLQYRGFDFEQIKQVL